MTLKNGKWDSSNYINQFEASVGQPLLVSCISKNANPSPNLTLYLNDQPWEETSGTSAIQEVRLGVPSGNYFQDRHDVPLRAMTCLQPNIRHFYLIL